MTYDNNELIKDLILYSKFVWNNKRFFLLVPLFAIFGIFIAFTSPKKYHASASFLPMSDNSQGLSGGLGGIASLAGIDVGAVKNNSEIPPLLYSKIVESVNFKKKLSESVIYFDEANNPVSYSWYCLNVYKPSKLSVLKKYTIGLPNLIKGVFSTKESDLPEFDTTDYQIPRLTNKDNYIFGKLSDQMDVRFDMTEGLVTISFEMENPEYSARMVSNLEKLLQEELIAFKSKKAKEYLNYTKTQYQDKKSEFETKQIQLAEFQDSNMSLNTASARNELQKIQSEYDLIFNVYLDLSKQLENAKLQLNKDTPMFYPINPVVIPSRSSTPNRTLIILVSLVLGLLFSVLFIFGRHLYYQIKSNW